MSQTQTALKAEIIAKHAPSVRRRAELEYQVIVALLSGCRKAGFTVVGVNDGESTHVTRTTADVLRIAFDLDESTVYFTRDGKRHWVYLVMGNDGWDVVSDFGWDGGDDMLHPAPGTFAAAVEAATRPIADKYA
jgi:hypothetical protein